MAFPSPAMAPGSFMDKDMIPTGDLDARIAHVVNWEFATVGNRPVDHLGRDVLLGSLMRDRRSKAFRSISRKTFEWAEARVAHLPAERRAAAVQLTTLDLLHRGLLGRLWGRIDPTAGLEVLGEVGRRIGASADTPIGTLIRLNSCRPAGAKYRRVDDFMEEDFTCGRTAICPWCHSRAVVALHERLVAGPCSPETLTGKHIVRYSLRATAEQLARMRLYAEFHARHGTENILTDVRAAQAFFSRLFKPRMAGMSGGLRSIRVEPVSHWRDETVGNGSCSTNLPDKVAGLGFEANLVGVLGEKAVALCKAKFANQKMLEFDGRDPFSGIDRPVFVQLHVGVASGDYPSALRLLLAGSAWGFAPEPGDFWWNEVQPIGFLEAFYDGIARDRDTGAILPTGAVGGVGRFGINGALSWSPWFFAEDDQWWAHADATRNVRIVECFGDWQSARKAGPVAVRPSSLVALAAHNEARAAKIAATAPDVEAAARATLGCKPALGYRRLKKELAAAGLVVSDRYAMKLLARLKADA